MENTLPTSGVSDGKVLSTNDQVLSGVSQNIVEPVQVINQTTSQPDPLLTNRVEPEDLDARWTRWKCLVCGFTYEGRQALRKCPKCGNEDPDKFEDAD